MEKGNVAGEIRTRDLDEAAALMVMGVKLIDVDRTDRNRCYFIFGGKAEEISKKFWSGELKVDPRKFALAQRDLKDRIFRG